VSDTMLYVSPCNGVCQYMTCTCCGGQLRVATQPQRVLGNLFAAYVSSCCEQLGPPLSTTGTALVWQLLVHIVPSRHQRSQKAHANPKELLALTTAAAVMDTCCVGWYATGCQSNQLHCGSGI
jgi:hypothetical protein